MARDATLRREPVLRAAEAPALRGAEPTFRSAPEPSLRDVLLTTTPAVEGRPVLAYLGLVTGEVVVAADILDETPVRKGFFARLRARSSAGEGEQSLSDAREGALRDLKARAAARGAEAVVGIGLSMQVLGGSLVVTATGTAVRIAEAQKP